MAAMMATATLWPRRPPLKLVPISPCGLHILPFVEFSSKGQQLMTTLASSPHTSIF